MNSQKDRWLPLSSLDVAIVIKITHQLHIISKIIRDSG